MELKNFTFYCDDALNSTAADNEKKLTIEHSLDGFSFSIATTGEKAVVFCLGYYESAYRLNAKRMQRRVEVIFNSEERLKNLKPKYIEVIHLNPHFTLLPTCLLDSSKLSSYISFAEQRQIKPSWLSVDELQSKTDVCNIYKTTPEIENFLSNRTKRLSSRHSISSFIDGVSEQKEVVKKEYGLHVNIYSRSINIVALKKGEITLANAFDYQTKEDFIYYLLLAANQLRIDPRDSDITLYGSAEKIAMLQHYCGRFFAGVKLAERRKNTAFSPVLDIAAGYDFYNVLKS